MPLPPHALPRALTAVLLTACALAHAAPFTPASDADIVETLPNKADPAVRRVDSLRLQLAARPARFCHGDTPTLADCTLVPQIFNAQRFKCRTDHVPNVMRVFDACMQLEAFERTQPNLAFYASPNNPTGNRFDDVILERIVRAFPNTLHIVDEAYGPFATRSLYTWCDQFPQVGTLGTLSKIGVAAARVGWVRLHPELAAEVEKVVERKAVEAPPPPAPKMRSSPRIP